MEAIKLFLTKFTDESITISSSVLLLVLLGIVAYWLYNRRKFQKLSHQIPASVVKNYLDSIIQNSTALKSSLFRGGGLEMGEGIPSVVPVADLPSGSITTGTVSDEVLNQKNAEIAALKSEVDTKNVTIADLEAQLAKAREGGEGGATSDEEVSALKADLENLKNQLAERQAALEAAQAAGGGDESGGGEALQKMTSERDELRERLMEYEIIEEDLANLKRLQQENEQLKKSLEEAGGAAPVAEAPVEEAPVAEETVEEAPSEEDEAMAAESPAEDPGAAIDDMDMSALMGKPFAEGELPPKEEAPAEEAAAADDDLGVPAQPEGEQKSAEELLSEFEKMLG